MKSFLNKPRRVFITVRQQHDQHQRHLGLPGEYHFSSVFSVINSVTLTEDWLGHEHVNFDSDNMLDTAMLKRNHLKKKGNKINKYG